LQNECKLSYITVNYNGLIDTCALIETIPFNDNLEVIVVDNASKQDEASIIAQRYPHVKTLRTNKNLGFAGGNNIGIKEAKGQYLFLINNDTIFKEFDIEPLIRRVDSSPQIGIVCPKIRFAWGTNPIQYAGYTPLSKITIRNQAIGFGEEDNGQYDTARPTPYAHGAAMLIKREAIEKVGLMPELYFLYYEEIDWSMMFTKAGYEIWYDPACTVYHKESQSTGQDSPLRTYYITRNRLLLVKRNWQGLYKYLAYCYLTCIVAFRDILKYTFKGKVDQAKAVINGISDFGMARYSSINSKR
jgi:hypothetical protein